MAYFPLDWRAAEAANNPALFQRAVVPQAAPKVDPVQEYKLQLGDEIRRFLVDKGADEARMMIGDAQMMREMPLTEMRSIYKDMVDRGFRRI